LTGGGGLSIVQASESSEDVEQVAAWLRENLATSEVSDSLLLSLCEQIDELGRLRTPEEIYWLVLANLLGREGTGIDEDEILDGRTGILSTTIWNKLYAFQRHAAIGALDKLDRFGGCIIADSVGLGKTFEALAVIKYYELKNDRVLVLCPKRLRDNWTLYRTNDRRNVLAGDRFNYDVLNHTDLSRDGGLSGDIDLANINWGNYDLVVIDESHNFRNKQYSSERATRYDRLMRQIVQEGIKTRVLMLSATPVNNRLTDLRNQIAFALEGDDTGLASVGISSVELTTRRAQMEFNRWLKLPAMERTSKKLIDMLDFDYFSLLDHLTIARSRRHIEKYYGTDETGKFPERLVPINIKADVDVRNEFRPISEINAEIRKLFLASYAPLRYVLPKKQVEYDKKYSKEVKGGSGLFRQADREESLVHLLRINVLKRMESSVHSFSLTIGRLLAEVSNTIEKIDASPASIDELEISEVDLDDPELEEFTVGGKIKVLLADVDLKRWKQDLKDDQRRLKNLLDVAKLITPERDAKLEQLRTMIRNKAQRPINRENKKIIVFTAFAETASYLYENISDWALAELGVHSALVTGSAGNQTTLKTSKRDLTAILSNFSPVSRERPADLQDSGEIDLLIATDCISEGQNLQDCDWLINYDIHWNPVRIIQRFGRIDRLGSKNDQIQLVNFWPNIELEEYIDLEKRVSGKMVLLDISATGEENLIERDSGDIMNDLEYRRRQLLQLQESVIDLEDLSSGISITDLTLTDFKIQLNQMSQVHGEVDQHPLGSMTVVATPAGSPPGAIFLLKADGRLETTEAGYPLAPYYLVHVGEDGEVVSAYTRTKDTLDVLRLAGGEVNQLDESLVAKFDKRAANGQKMEALRRLAVIAMQSVVGRKIETSVESLFKAGGTNALTLGSIAEDSFEIVAVMVLEPRS
jgi:superfamily II DNA or RNA helicase